MSTAVAEKTKARKADVTVLPPVSPMTEGERYAAIVTRAMSDPSVDMDKLERLCALMEKAAERDKEAAFNAAMSAAQRGMEPIAKDADNRQTRSKYASYAALDRALRPIYTEAGFAISYNTEEGAPADHIRLVAFCSHAAGFTRKYTLDMPNDGKGAKGGDVMTKTHATGAATTYGQRYLLKMIFNVAIGENDTDGNTVAPSDLITEAQIAELRALLKATDTDEKSFCEIGEVESLSDITKANFPKALMVLKQKNAAYLKATQK